MISQRQTSRVDPPPLSGNAASDVWLVGDQNRVSEATTPLQRIACCSIGGCTVTPLGCAPRYCYSRCWGWDTRRDSARLLNDTVLARLHVSCASFLPLVTVISKMSVSNFCFIFLIFLHFFFFRTFFKTLYGRRMINHRLENTIYEKVKEKKELEVLVRKERIFTMEAMAWRPAYLTSQLNSLMAQVVPPNSWALSTK